MHDLSEPFLNGHKFESKLFIRHCKRAARTLPGSAGRLPAETPTASAQWQAEGIGFLKGTWIHWLSTTCYGLEENGRHVRQPFSLPLERLASSQRLEDLRRAPFVLSCQAVENCGLHDLSNRHLDAHGASYGYSLQIQRAKSMSSNAGSRDRRRVGFSRARTPSELHSTSSNSLTHSLEHTSHEHEQVDAKNPPLRQALSMNELTARPE